MEALENVSDAFGRVFSGVERGIRGLFGSANDRDVRKLGFIRDKAGNTTVRAGSMLERVNAQADAVGALSEGELKGTAELMRGRLASGETLDDILPDMFARIREAGERYLQMRHYDVQLVGGAILHSGRIAEMVTGEGKTLVATLPAALNAVGGHVHCVTVNDYLARRDMEWMAPLYMGLGLTVDAIQGEQDPGRRQKAYACDITYGTNNEFGFDYLRDNMKPHKSLQVQGPLDFALVDEIDNILIDEARTPLIISGKAEDDLSKYPTADKIARQLNKGEDFEVKEKERTCHLTDAGVRRAEKLAGVESFYTAGNMEWPHLIDNALRAHYLFQRDVHYVVEPGQDRQTGRVEMDVVIVDEHTGRKMTGRQWSDGLHQAVQAKEGIRIREQNQTYATITLQNYFKLYNKLAGMTGTAMTEADEFFKIYGLDVVAVPTNRPMQRINSADMIYRTEREKWNAVLEEVKEVHATGRPVLVGTTNIEKSEIVSELLKKHGIKHDLLNAKQHEREAEIVAQAGRRGAVTIATNMAGRGTDIILGGNPEHMAWDELSKTYESRLDVPKSEWDRVTDEIAERHGMKQEGAALKELGGLHVVGTERHDARRIDLQLRGRAGRQGDPGSSRFFLSLDDDLMRIFAGDFVRAVLDRIGMQEGEAIESGMVSRRIEKAQKRVEERNFDARKNLLEYDEVMDHQRKEVYSFRQRILDGANCREMISEMIEKQVGHWTRHFLDINYRWDTIAAWASRNIGITVEAANLRDMTREQVETYLRDEAKMQAEEMVQEQVEEALPQDEEESEWNWQALSRWVNGQYGLNTNERELRKIGRETVAEELQRRAREAVDRFNLQDLNILMEEDFPQKQLGGFMLQQYGLDVRPADLPPSGEADDAVDFLLEKVNAAYREQEIRFPVRIGMTNFMPQNARGEARDTAGLTRWAANRFREDLPADYFETKARHQIEPDLMHRSRRFFPGEEEIDRVHDLVDRAYPPAEHNGDTAVDRSALEELVQFARGELEARLDADTLAAADRAEARQSVLAAFDRKYRPELGEAERAILLDVLDHSWKEHLLYMDQLKAGIGLVGYAQKDPKTEYKREGMRAFEEMWDRIGETVTGAVFRMEQPNPEFAARSAFAHGTARHPDAPAPEEAEAEQAHRQYQEQSGGREAGSEQAAVATIRKSDDQKVGRNDPCPCGSGKKFKKCHGAG